MRKIIYLFGFIICSISAYCQTAQFDWIKRIGDSGTDCPGVVANDSIGNLYVAGAFVGQLVFGADTINSTTTANSSIFLAKYDGAGNPIWARKLPMTNGNIGACNAITLSKMRVSTRGRIYLVGTLNYNSYLKEYFTISRNDGSLVGYTDQAINNSNVDIDVDSADNSYMTGLVIGATDNHFIIKFDSSGNTKWSYVYSSASKPYNIRYADGYIYIAGEFKSQLQLSDTLGSPVITLNASAGINDWDFFTAKYSKNGQLISASRNDGLLSNASGPFNLACDFTTSNKWRIAAIDPSLNSYTKEYSTAALAQTDSAFINTTSCFYTPYCTMRSSLFRNESVFSYDGLACAPRTAYILDSVGNTTSIVTVPYAGPTNTIPKREYSFDKHGNLFVCSSMTGSINYNDSNGNKVLNSIGGSKDIYIAKYHTCAKYNPLVTKAGDTLWCTVPGLRYDWYRSTNSASSLGTDRFLIPGQDGSYRVVVSDGWGCSDTSAFFAYTASTGVASIKRTPSIIVQPNPATTEISISGLPIASWILVTDISGKTVIRTTCSGNKMRIDVSSLSQGIYFIRTAYGKYKFVRI